MKKILIIVCLILTSCAPGPRFSTELKSDPIVTLESSLAQIEMALSVAKMQYMLWQWSVRDKESIFSETIDTQFNKRIEFLEKQEKIVAEEIRKRTHG